MVRTVSTENSVDRTVAPKQLIALIQEAHRERGKISTISGALGERVKLAIDNGHLHRGAFALSVRLYKMDELKREDFLRQIDLYVDICRAGGLFGAEHAGDLVEDAEREQEAQAEADADAGEGEPVPLSAAAKAVQKGIKQLAPKRRGRPPGSGKKGLDGAEATSGTRVQ
jgi:hypothetical protein